MARDGCHIDDSPSGCDHQRGEGLDNSQRSPEVDIKDMPGLDDIDIEYRGKMVAAGVVNEDIELAPGLVLNGGNGIGNVGRFLDIQR